MKKLLTLVCVLSALLITSCMVGPSYEEDNSYDPQPDPQPELKIGDIYKIEGKTGVVWAVSKDGTHGRIISLEQTKCKWDEAQQWCSELGEGWRLPTVQELQMIYELKNNQDFNDGIFFADAPEMMWGQWYWSGEEYNSTNAWGVHMGGGSTNYYTKGHLSSYARAVFAF